MSNDWSINEDIFAVLKKKFRSQDMVNLEKTRWHVYYLFDYVKPKLYDKYDDESINRSKEIWKFKNFDVDANEYFKNEIINGIDRILTNIIKDDVKFLGLSYVPPSKVGKPSPMRNVIFEIIESHRKGEIKIGPVDELKIYNYSNLLKRVSDVPTSHLEKKRASYPEHLESIECEGRLVSSARNMDIIILLDDITSSGASMNACKNILAENKINKRDIIKFAIFQSVWDREE